MRCVRATRTNFQQRKLLTEIEMTSKLMSIICDSQFFTIYLFLHLIKDRTFKVYLEKQSNLQKLPLKGKDSNKNEHFRNLSTLLRTKDFDNNMLKLKTETPCKVFNFHQHVLKTKKFIQNPFKI